MANHLTIRPFEKSNEAVIVALWNRVFPDDPPHNDPVEVIRRKLAVQPDLFLVGIVDSRLIGSVLAGFDGVRGWIHHLAIDPAYRRRGYATSLVRAAEEGLDLVGCPKLNLQVRAGNASAVSFYESLGYEVENRVSLGKRLGKWASPEE